MHYASVSISFAVGVAFCIGCAKLDNEVTERAAANENRVPLEEQHAGKEHSAHSHGQAEHEHAGAKHVEHDHSAHDHSEHDHAKHDADAHEHAEHQHDSSVPSEAAPSGPPTKLDLAVAKELAELPDEDLKLAVAQRFCPIHVYTRLGIKGAPIKIEGSGKPFFVCCGDCVEEAKQGGAKLKRTVNTLKKVTARLSQLSPEQREIAETQKYCPVYENRLLGSMGTPLVIELNGKSIYLCCDDCTPDARDAPEKTLANAKRLVERGTEASKSNQLDP